MRTISLRICVITTRSWSKRIQSNESLWSRFERLRASGTPADTTCWDHVPFATLALSTYNKCLECMPIEAQRKHTEVIASVHFPYLGRSSEKIYLVIYIYEGTMKPFIFEKRHHVLSYFRSGLPFIPAIHSRFVRLCSWRSNMATQEKH